MNKYTVEGDFWIPEESGAVGETRENKRRGRGRSWRRGEGGRVAEGEEEGRARVVARGKEQE